MFDRWYKTIEHRMSAGVPRPRPIGIDLLDIESYTQEDHIADADGNRVPVTVVKTKSGSSHLLCVECVDFERVLFGEETPGLASEVPGGQLIEVRIPARRRRVG